MSRSPEEIEREIEETRLAVDRTVEALKDKMSPQHLAQEFARATQDRASRVGNMVATQAKRHPVALALAGAGLAFLLYQLRSKQSNERTHDLHATLDDYLPVQGVRAPLRDDDIPRGRVSGAVQTAKQYEKRMENTVVRALQDEPLIIGALALALGAAVGAALPSTPAERRYLGRVRERAVNGVRDAAQRGVDEVKGAVHDAKEAIRVRTARQEPPPADYVAERLN
jgi:hypothetical protein